MIFSQAFDFGAVRRDVNLVNMLNNDFLVGKIGVDIDENEPFEIFAFCTAPFM